MRYINRIDIPSDTNKIKIDEYIKLSFNIPIAKTVEGFETALRFKMSDKYSSIVRTHTGESPLAEHVAIFVDIDVFYNLAMAVEIERLDEELVELRAAKNQLFEDMVTDKSRQLFLKEIES
jgi:uncharacterized protein (TIGR04255 family)